MNQVQMNPVQINQVQMPVKGIQGWRWCDLYRVSCYSTKPSCVYQSWFYYV